MEGKERKIFALFSAFLVLLIGVIIAVSLFAPQNRSPLAVPQSQKNGATAEMQDVVSVTLEEAKAVALSDAGINNADSVFFTSQMLSYDDGKQVYEIDFVDAASEYEYDISPFDKTIISKSVEPRD